MWLMVRRILRFYRKTLITCLIDGLTTFGALELSNNSINTMRATRHLFAILTDAGILLHPNTPTGLTGVLTHPNPRPHLIYLYNQTLDKLTKLPETSAYRQSAEAVTKHRLQIIESAKPNGFEAWEARVHKQIEENPLMFGPKGGAHRESVGGKQYVVASRLAAVDERLLEWDGDMVGERGEGPSSIEQKAGQAMDLGNSRPLEEFQAVGVQLEDEPPLNAQQYVEMGGIGKVMCLYTDYFMQSWRH